MTFKINEENCIGCGICQSICPKCFSIKNGVAKVSGADSGDCNPTEVQDSCPCQAIIIENED